MRKLLTAIFVMGFLVGCAKICGFGSGGDSAGLKCIGFFSQARPGMTQKEVKALLGMPQRKNFDISYRDKTYDEAWVYDTSPPTVLYFANGILEHKEYQQ